MSERPGIKPLSTRSKPRSARSGSLTSRLPFPGGLAGNLAVIFGLFGISVAVGAGLGKWSSARYAMPEGAALVSDEPVFSEVNFSPLLGLGGPIETLLYDQDPEEDIYDQSLSEVESEAGIKKEFYVITSQDNLYTALQCFGVNRDIIVRWIELAKKEYNLARLKPGQSFWLSLDEARRPGDASWREVGTPSPLFRKIEQKE